MSRNYVVYLYLSWDILIGKMKSQQKEKTKATSTDKSKSIKTFGYIYPQTGSGLLYKPGFPPINKALCT